MSQLLKQETKENIKNTAKESFLILLYEMIGTAMRSALISSYYAQKIIADSPSTDNVGLLLGMFICIMFSARISGSHFNPCITMSYMIGNVKQGKFDRILGFLYIVAQFVGAQAGMILGSIFMSGRNLKINLDVSADDYI